MALVKERMINKVDKCYLKNDFTLVNVKIEDETYEYYENDCLIKKGVSKKIKEFSLPVNPVFHYNHMIICDYYRGVEIIGETHEFLPITSVYKSSYYQNTLVFIRQKLVTIYDLNTHQIVEEFNCSAENCSVSQFKQYLLFYRKYRSTSYLYDMKSCIWLELGNFKIDGLLHKISIEDNILYVFASNELMFFDIKNKEIICRVTVKYQADICYYTGRLEVNPQKGIVLKKDPTPKDIHSYLFHKFGLLNFINYTDENIILDLYGKFVAEKVDSLRKIMSLPLYYKQSYAELQSVKNKIEQTTLELNKLI